MIDWQVVGVVAAVVSAMCAVIAAGVAVAVWRQARGADLTAAIEDGDRESREQIDDVSQQLGNLRNSIARIESEQKHHLTLRSLSPLHEKINQVALDLRGNRAETRAFGEQLRQIQNYLMKNLP